MAQKRIMESRHRKVLQDRAESLKEEGDIREYKAMHEHVFLSSWLREDGKDKEERTMEIGKETKEETGKKEEERRGERRERDGEC